MDVHNSAHIQITPPKPTSLSINLLPIGKSHVQGRAVKLAKCPSLPKNQSRCSSSHQKTTIANNKDPYLFLSLISPGKNCLEPAKITPETENMLHDVYKKRRRCKQYNYSAIRLFQKIYKMQYLLPEKQ